MKKVDSSYRKSPWPGLEEAARFNRGSAKAGFLEREIDAGIAGYALLLRNTHGTGRAGRVRIVHEARYVHTRNLHCAELAEATRACESPVRE